MNKLSDTQVLQNAEIAQKLIDTFPEERRIKVKKMFEGIVGSEFISAPASPRESWHNCFPGGLCDHSIRVVSNLVRLSKTLAPGKFSAETLTFVGLFHDLGKVGDGEEPYYIPHPSDWHRKQGTLYEVNKDCIHMPTSERGLYILQKHGITLTSDEYLAIRLNDGQYDETNKRYALHEPDLALLVHFADRWATAVEKS